MVDLSTLEGLKKKVESLRQEAERAKGGLDVALKRLKAEHGCATLEAARQELKKLQVQEAKEERALEVALEGFKSEWKDVLDGSEDE